jgi:uncharacterized protein (TIGR01244 family)
MTSGRERRNTVNKAVGAAVACFTLLGACAVAQGEQPKENRPSVAIDRDHLPQRVTDVTGVHGVLFRDGRVFIGGQPSEGALEQLRALGVTTVVNLRIPAEMSNWRQVPFDEASYAARLGMEYVRIPIGGREYPFSPQDVERLAQVLERGHGPVLLHCRTGDRASYLWTAYLIRYGGLDLNVALARGRVIAIGPDPLEELLGQPLKLEWAVPPTEPPVGTPQAR